MTNRVSMLCGHKTRIKEHIRIKINRSQTEAASAPVVARVGGGEVVEQAEVGGQETGHLEGGQDYAPIIRMAKQIITSETSGPGGGGSE